MSKADTMIKELEELNDNLKKLHADDDPLEQMGEVASDFKAAERSARRATEKLLDVDD